MFAPIPWMGGKFNMRKHLYAIFDRIQRDAFIDVFGGSGSIIFGKPPERQEIYNDANRLLAHLMRSLRDPSTNAVMVELSRWTPHSREFWYENRDICLAWRDGDQELLKERIAKAKLASYPVDAVVAWAFFYCQTCGFGGKLLSTYGGGMCRARHGSQAPRYKNRVDNLAAYAKRLDHVQIENLDALELMRRRDKDFALFYCDPPYDVACSDNYDGFGGTWNPEKRDEFIELCCRIQASAVISCYDNEAYQRLLGAGYKREQFAALSCINSDSNAMPRTETVYWRWSGFVSKRRLF